MNGISEAVRRENGETEKSGQCKIKSGAEPACMIFLI
jgi:hypothetical protein